MLDVTTRVIFNDDHTLYRDSIRRFIKMEMTPNIPKWEAQRLIDKSFWLKCGEAGLLCPTVPAEYGGSGLDFVANVVIGEEIAYTGCTTGINLHSDIIVDYLLAYGSEEQKETWLPKMVTGEVITAIAMTEPDAGSDLRGIRSHAKRVDGGFVINGSKTYITNGQNAGLFIVAAQTEIEKGKSALSLFLVPGESAGLIRGNKLDKIGMHTSDTSEIFLEECFVQDKMVLGSLHQGLRQLTTQLPQERLSIAINCLSHAQRAFDVVLDFAKNRRIFGRSLHDFQNSKFQLADMKMKLQVAWAHLDWCIQRHLQGVLTPEEAAAVKLFNSEMQWEICDMALQLHGGAGYMNEYEISSLWKDARISKIYGGTSEIMREIIGRSL